MSMVLMTTWKVLLVVLTVLITFGVPLVFLYAVSVQQNVFLDLILMCDAFGLAFLYGAIMVWVIEEVVGQPRRARAEPDSVP
jgi:hypothetical protein